MLEWIVEPLRYAFMVRGLIAAVLVGATCALVGSYVVLRGMTFLGDVLAHAILPGVAVAYLIAGSSPGALFWGGLIAGVLKMHPLAFLVATAAGKSLRLILVALACNGGLPFLTQFFDPRQAP